MGVRSNEKIILDLEKEVEFLKKMIATKDILIDNYKIIVDGYKKMANDLNDKSEKHLKKVEMDLNDKKKLMEAFLMYKRRTLKLTKTINGFYKNNDYKSRLN